MKNTPGEEKLMRMVEAMEASMDGMAILNSQEKYIYLNEAHAAIYGYERPGELVGKTWTILYDKKELKRFKEYIMPELIREGKWRGRATGIKKDGSRFPQELSLTRLSNGGIICVVRDITDRKRVEEKLKKSEKRYRTLFHISPAGMMLEDSQGNILEVNRALCEMTGYEKDELEGRDIFELFVLPGQQKLARENMERILAGEDLELETRGRTRDGDLFYVNLKETRFELADGSKGILSMHIDITERKKKEEKLRRQLKFEKMITAISAYFLDTSLDRIKEAIRFALAKTGGFFAAKRCYFFQYSEERDNLDCTCEWYGEGIEPRINKMDIFSEEQLKQRLKEEPVYITDLKSRCNRKDVKSILTIPVIVNNSPEGFIGLETAEKKKEGVEEEIFRLRVIAGLMANFISRCRAEKTTRKLTYHDQLTGLYNRTFMEEEIDRLDVERQLPLSIIMADLNGLKLINDTYGHAKGDEILKETARILENACRSEDIIARWGGDEFVIFLPGASKEVARKVCKRIEKGCTEIKVGQRKEEKITISIAQGCGEKVAVEEDIYKILKKAEDRMYKDKLLESRSAKSHILKTILKTLQEKSQETEEHARRMQKMAFQLGKKIQLAPAELDKLSLLASLHDIGKTVIAEEILNKKSSLTGEEWEIIKEHPHTGYRICSAVDEFSHIALEVLAHHEWWDGTGYPRGLKREEIPLLARIISIVDAYDVMTNGRPYKKAMSSADALREITRCAGSQFDPELVKKFREIMAD